MTEWMVLPSTTTQHALDQDTTARMQRTAPGMVRFYCGLRIRRPSGLFVGPLGSRCRKCESLAPKE
jgi:hypothetical protein